MRVSGWCERCRRFTRVSVDSRSLITGGVPTGVCDDCDRPRVRPDGRSRHA